MKHGPMKAAIMKRRSHGIDMSHGGEAEASQAHDKMSDLAPPGESGDEEIREDMLRPEIDETSDVDQVRHRLTKNELAKTDADEGTDHAMLDGMSDYEKHDLSTREKPRSLGERARMSELHSKHGHKQ